MANVSLRQFREEVNHLQAQINELKLSLVPPLRREIEPPKSLATPSLADLFDDKIIAVLNAGGYYDLESVAAATDDQLRELKGIGPARLTEIRSVLQGE